MSQPTGDLTHVNEQGRARMVDVSAKPRTARVARAASFVRMRPDTLELVRTGGCKKGDVLAVAQVAGIMAAKRCWELVPMCHSIALTGADVSFSLVGAPDPANAATPERCGVAIEATCRCTGETGVEMEALTAAGVAALTVYDMLKAHQRDMVVESTRLLEKDGGKSGHFVAAEKGGASAVPAAAATTPTPTTPCGRVEAVSVSERKGTRKVPRDSSELVVGMGVAGDAHAGAWHRQVSLLPAESVERMREALLRGQGVEAGRVDVASELGPGAFAENVLVRGMDLASLPVGTTLAAGDARLVVTQIGKTCHADCEIRRLVGTCVMPTDGIFCVVTRAGVLRAGDEVRVVGEGEL